MGGTFLGGGVRTPRWRDGPTSPSKRNQEKPWPQVGLGCSLTSADLGSHASSTGCAQPGRALSFPVGSKGKQETGLHEAAPLPASPPPRPVECTGGRRKGRLCKASRGPGRRGRPPMNSLLFPARDCTAPTAPAVLASASGAWGGRNVSRDAGRE